MLLKDYMKWIWKNFSELSQLELYQIIQLREKIFIVEQNCSYLDCDGLDQKAIHLLGLKDGHLAAYLRVFAPGLKYNEASFGRVVTSIENRKLGYGKELTQMAISQINSSFGNVGIRISAQKYLENFYSSFGFKQIGNEYLEDNIPHIEMLLK